MVEGEGDDDVDGDVDGEGEGECEGDNDVGGDVVGEGSENGGDRADGEVSAVEGVNADKVNDFLAPIGLSRSTPVKRLEGLAERKGESMV